MKGGGYIYVEPNADSGIVIEQQKEQIKSYAATIGCTIDKFFIEENCSMRRPFRERHAGRKILQHAGPQDIIITTRARWILSSAKEGLWLVKNLYANGVSLYCMDIDENISLPKQRKLVVSEGGAKLVRQLLEALAVSESSKHGEAIKAAKKKMKTEGKYLGGPVPFGWQVRDGFLVEDHQQQIILDKIRDMRQERWSYRDISIKLRKEFGVKLSHEGVRRVLSNNDA